MSSRALLKIAFVLASTAIAAVGTFRAVSALAAKHFAPSPQIGLTAAMAGLFAGGLAALVTLILVARKSPKGRD